MTFQSIAKNALFTILFNILLLFSSQFVTTSHKIRPHVYLFYNYVINFFALISNSYILSALSTFVFLTI